MRAPPPAILRAAAGVALFACGGTAPPVPVVHLIVAGNTVGTSFSEVTGAVWLDDDRWAVLAPSDQVVAVVDMGAGTVRSLGGTSAKEMLHPATLFRAGDTLFVGDWGRRRTTAWTLNGQLVRAIPVSGGLRGALPRARDAAGRFYYELAPPPGPDGRGNRDSASIVRDDGLQEHADTIARLSPLDLAEVIGDAGRRFERRVFSGEDAWGVLPDGSLWVARVYLNRVDWRSRDGVWQRGRPLPDRVLEVTRYDREMFLRRFPPELRSTAEQLPFAAVKPPFEKGLTGPGGEAWLQKSRAPADTTCRYHVIDREGRLLRELQVPGAGWVVAIGGGTVLVAERSRDGIRLLRFAIPATPTTP